MTLTHTWKKFDPYGIGLDNIFDQLESLSGRSTNYPPYNIIKHDESNYEIEIALAGFKSDEIEVSTEQNVLRVTSKDERRDTERTYVYKGLSKRSFTNSWQLSDDVRVSDVGFADGLLSISLERIVPEEKKKTIYSLNVNHDKNLLTE